MLWFRQARPFSAQTVRKRAGGLEKRIVSWLRVGYDEVCNNGKMHREEKSLGETKAYTFKVKPQEDSNIYRLIQIDSGKTLDDLPQRHTPGL